ncbi:SURF1 family cytochrome oxidase biogenesis protein [Sphingomonas abaci]|uniref:SURF1-like protein n=1 Tax=Sphingomonas abaci TaxID=237611 RepID=A0A7W7AGN7_9SPHN|nr:surfeit locus 1 family protein [Sphingomonas abaci]
MRRLPLISTLLVALAVAAMIALGLWQLLDRLPQKRAFLQQLAANPARPAIPFPDRTDERWLFRRATGRCAPPVTVRLAGAGAMGFRAIATCGGGATPMLVQLGTTRDPNARPVWSGGAVSGTIGHAPNGQSLIGAALHPQPPRLMLVAATPLAGLAPNPAPDLDSVPNNHLAYAVQWFLFAGVAVVIYALALRRRSPRAK